MALPHFFVSRLVRNTRNHRRPVSVWTDLLGRTLDRNGSGV